MELAEKYLLPLIVAFIAILAPIHALLLTTGFLIMSDMILGVWAANVRKEKITSARLRDTPTKMLVYHMVLVLGFFVEKFMLHDTFPLTKVAAGCIGLVEIKSVYENASIVLGKPLFGEIIKKLGSKSSK